MPSWRRLLKKSKQCAEEPELIYTRCPSSHEISSLPDKPKIRKRSNNPETINKLGVTVIQTKESSKAAV